MLVCSFRERSARLINVKGCPRSDYISGWKGTTFTSRVYNTLEINDLKNNPKLLNDHMDFNSSLLLNSRWISPADVATKFDPYNLDVFVLCRGTLCPTLLLCENKRFSETIRTFNKIAYSFLKWPQSNCRTSSSVVVHGQRWTLTSRWI